MASVAIFNFPAAIGKFKAVGAVIVSLSVRVYTSFYGFQPAFIFSPLGSLKGLSYLIMQSFLRTYLGISTKRNWNIFGHIYGSAD